MKGKQIESLPTSQQLEGELNRENLRHRYRHMVRSTISILVVVAAAAVLVSTILLPVLRVYGYSMEGWNNFYTAVGVDSGCMDVDHSST